MGRRVQPDERHRTTKAITLSEGTWHEARLIPTSGIAGSDEQERRATSAVLAVMGVVREFSRAVLTALGAPSGTVETYIEVPFMLGGKRCYYATRSDSAVRLPARLYQA
jgi:hypothetical protein